MATVRELRLVMMPMRRPPRRPREIPRPSWAAKPLASMPLPSASGITKIWPSVRTPSTSKMRILMSFARIAEIQRSLDDDTLAGLEESGGPPGYRNVWVGLPPVAFNPNVALATMIPVALHPVGVGVAVAA